MTNPTPTPAKAPYTAPAHFVAWLDAEKGRGAYFEKIDRGLFAPLITKLKTGWLPITFELAVRLERAQKPSDQPLRALDLMTFLEHRDLYLYVTGQQPAPAPLEPRPRATRKADRSTRQPRTVAGA